ncbi:glycoside hydrolase family 47 protein [Microthyrium microscopicum]|uniref:alpha-1,2-Mannosidase n=1 Tax=Microthyrium microscopicum TaxID=703497 RepID=A0A6A6U9U6_9PEZI|nr:glycoside hydrolase family 47 protein [Microthyrium microscopicum]
MTEGRLMRWSRRWPPERVVPLSFPIIGIFIVVLFVNIITPSQQPLDQPPTAPSSTLERSDAIKAAFDFAWDGYYKLAFPHDELKPVSNTPGTSRNDWGATAVDALGTAVLMDKKNIINIVLEHVAQTDFTHTNTSISVFESTIRYIGGLLSAYELLSGPFQRSVPAGFNLNILLEKAVNLADLLSKAFGEGKNLPSGMLDPKTLQGNGENSLAGAGSLVLEWTILSNLVGNSTYANLTQLAQSFLMNPTPKKAESFPGLVPTEIDIASGSFLKGTVTWGGSADSFYEYLLKMFVYDPKSFGLYRDRWVQAADSTIRYLASSPKKFPNITFIGRYGQNGFIPESGHMECFAGGNFILGGTVLNETRYTEFGLRLIDGCHHTYASTKTGIGPEQFKWEPNQCQQQQVAPTWSCDGPQNPEDQAMNNASGIWITEPSYNLRPETLESYYYAYRLTKDQKYRDWAWDAWLAIDKGTRLENGYSYLRNVNVPDDQRWYGDNQESFLFSETFKYLFLIFDDGDGEWHVSGTGTNKWVYNTEAHPLRTKKFYERLTK